jgi:hypothetical protein
MKIFSRILSLLVIASLGLFYAGCGGSSSTGKAAEQTQLESLSKTWTLQSVTLGGVDKSSDFTGVTLILSGTYAAGGTYAYHMKGTFPNPSPWPNTGTWKFGGKTGTALTTQITRDTGDNLIAMTYTLTGSSLEIKFTLPESAAGWTGGVFARSAQVKGDWVFTFN